jgi:uracil-DNA glycosylase
MGSDIAQKTISPEWDTLLADEFTKPYFASLLERASDSAQAGTICPPQEKIFRAFLLCAPKDVRVLILGQDPYHTKGVADGLAFSTAEGNPIPPSLKNIFKEVAQEFHSPLRSSPDLSDWARQGVLLLNTALTTVEGSAHAHKEFGWQNLTDAVISSVSDKCAHVVFMLWGNEAERARALIDPSRHLILTSPHPSPLSAYRGFLGNGHFIKANDYLKTHGRDTIKWCEC